MSGLLLVTILLGANPDSAADVITLRDGHVVLGQVIEPSPRGKALVVVRRAWAQSALPELSRRWEQAEAPARKHANDQRLARLIAWKKERPRVAGKDDAISDWLDREIDRLKAPAGQGEPSRLMVVALNRAEVKLLVRRPEATARLLRLGWRINLRDAELKPIAELKSALEARGFAPNSPDPALVADLLPLTSETENHWRLRRAVTEVANEPSLRFIRYGDLVLPEDSTAAGAGVGMEALTGALKSLLGDEPRVDALAARSSEVARKGRVGMIVTRLNLGADTDAVTVESTLWVRTGNDHWESAISRPASVRMNDARADEAAVVGGDPQVKAILGVVESLGLGDLTPALKNAGAATKRALGMARSELQRDLDALTLPVTVGP